MENKINIAELLRDCPTGMELDCLMYDNLYFKCIREHAAYPIVCYTIDSKGETEEITFNWYGKYALLDTAKCVIFPKGKTTWEGFHRPFEDGDIIYTKHKLGTEFISIFQIEYERDICTYWDINLSTNKLIGNLHEGNAFKVFIEKDKVKEQRFATEEEKARLFQVIKDNGYKWNAETKTLEKITRPNFKVGDWVVRDDTIAQILDIQEQYYIGLDVNGKDFVSSRFLDGDKIHLWTINDAKDGDVLFHSDSASNGIFIFKEILQLGTLQKVICYCDYDSEDGFCLGENHTCCWADSKILRPATEERRNRLFQKMREAGYRWNAETKTLDKLIEPSFKVGDKVRHKNNHNVVFTITDIKEDTYVCGAAKAFWLDDQDKYEVIHEPKFKVGDRIRKKGDKIATFTISDIGDLCYYCGEYVICNISYQDDYELVPNKFDINTLKPLQPVLVRDSNIGRWDITFYELYDSINKIYPYRTLGGCIYKQCIPYEENEYLLGKTDDCNDFYKTWE